MVGLVRHRRTKGPETDRPYLNHRATPRLHPCGSRYPSYRFSDKSGATNTSYRLLSGVILSLRCRVHDVPSQVGCMSADTGGYALTFRCLNCGRHEALASLLSNIVLSDNEIKTRILEATCKVYGWLNRPAVTNVPVLTSRLVLLCR